MSNKKATKRALLTSITALAMCVVMLVGTTFAWFTDTATANVNKIQAGNLDVDIVSKENVSLEGQTLYFRDKNGGTDILWEPGATFNLDAFKIVNKGNLAIKYEITVNGVTGSNKLLEAIDFTVTKNGASVALADLKGVLLPAGKTAAAGEEVGETAAIVISGTMKTSAGNEYKNLTLDGISITVKAMQASYEYDSNGNTYDKDANGNPDNPTWSISANVTAPVASGGNTVISNADKTAVATVPAEAVADNTKELTWNVTASDSAAASVSVSSEQAAVGYEVKVGGLKENNTTPVTVELKVGAGLTGVKLYHNGKEMTAVTTAGNLGDGEYYYDKDSGILTFATNTFSPFAVVYDAPTAIIGDTYYNTLADAFAAAEDGDTITLLKSTNGGGIVAAEGKFAAEGLTVDFNGHTYTVGGVLVGSSGTGTNASQLLRDNKITFKNGSFVGVTEGTKPAEDTPNWHGAPAMMIQNYCDLTLDNMIVTGGDQTVYTVSNNNGNVVIKDTTINKGGAKGYGYGPYAFDVCRYSSYPSVNVTVTGNSVINGDVEVSGTIGVGQDRQLTINGGKFYGKFKVANEPANITINGGEFVDLTNAVKYAADGATIKLAADVEQNSMLSITKSMTLDLNGKTIYNTEDIWDVSGNALISIENGANVTFTGNGAVKAKQDDCYTINVKDGTLTIENGEYVGNVSAVQVQKGQLNIKGGKFSLLQLWDGKATYLINCIDAAYKDGTAVVSITGGEFKGSDMSASTSENPAAKFVAEGYKSVKDGDWFKVVAD